MMAMWTFEEASARLYRAMVARREAKAALRKYREERGSCEWENPTAGEDTIFPCYRDIRAMEWCDVCHGSQPLWEAYRAAAIEQGAARRTFMAVGKRTVERVQ